MQDELAWILGILVAAILVALAITLLTAHAQGCEQLMTGLIICEPGYTPILVA